MRKQVMYCDCCKQEMFNSNQGYANLTVDMGYGRKDNFDYKEICNDCTKKLYEFIEQLTLNPKTP